MIRERARVEPRREVTAIATRRVYRITTFVPPDHVDQLLEGVERIVPLRFGNYDSSAWWSAVGTEQFTPLPGAKPTVGRPGIVERVPTIRVEFAIPLDDDLLSSVIEDGIKPHHPWEEPAIFIDDCLVTASRIFEPNNEMGSTPRSSQVAGPIRS